MAAFDLDAFVEAGGTKKPFRLRISEPEKAANAKDFFCRVHAPDLFATDREIFGATAEQAEAVALDFVRSLLQGKRLVDAHGNQIDF
jgi:hypothetical protein